MPKNNITKYTYMVHWKKISIFILLSMTLVNCIPTATCEDNLNYNKFGIDNFKIAKIKKRARGEVFLVNPRDESIFVAEIFGELLFDVLKAGDLISKKKEENIITAKRAEYVIKYELYCKEDDPLLKIDTLSR